MVSASLLPPRRLRSTLHRARELVLELDAAASQAGMGAGRGVAELALDAAQLELHA